jgi:hypothetical protein
MMSSRLSMPLAAAKTEVGRRHRASLGVGLLVAVGLALTGCTVYSDSSGRVNGVTIGPPVVVEPPPPPPVFIAPEPVPPGYYYLSPPRAPRSSHRAKKPVGALPAPAPVG